MLKSNWQYFQGWGVEIGGYWAVIIIILIANGCVSGFFCSDLADQKGYHGSSAFWLGFFFSVIALLYYAGLPLSEEKRMSDLKELSKLLGGSGSAVGVDNVLTADSPSAQASKSSAAPLSEAMDQTDKTAHRMIIEQGSEYCRCSLCRKFQSSDRQTCFRCGAKFTGNIISPEAPASDEPKTAHRIPVAEDDTHCRCSQCGEMQRSDRRVCYRCGATFIDD